MFVENVCGHLFVDITIEQTLSHDFNHSKTLFYSLIWKHYATFLFIKPI